MPIIAADLLDPAHGNVGLSGGTFVVVYNPNLFTVSASDVQIGSLPSSSTGWSVAANSPDARPAYHRPAKQRFRHYHHHQRRQPGDNQLPRQKQRRRWGQAISTWPPTMHGSAPFTGIDDQNYDPYTLVPAPQDNAVLSPAYAYTGSDPADGIVTITGVNLPPVAANYAYSITSQAVAGDPGLTVAAPGVLANDSDPQSYPLTAALVASPAHGTVAPQCQRFVHLHAKPRLCRRRQFHLPGQRRLS